MRFAFLIFAVLSALPVIGSAQVELSFYAGGQAAAGSEAAIRDSATGDDDFDVQWDRPSAAAPVYSGVRATRWRSATFGVGVDLAHNGIAAKNASLPDDIQVLAFADGLNTFTVNAYHRWNDVVAGVTPYIGGGVGLSLPYVEVVDGLNETAGYQLTGPAATWIAGARLPLNDQWSVFGEYKGTYAANTADLDGGGTLQADVLTNALNVGVSFNF